MVKQKMRDKYTTEDVFEALIAFAAPVLFLVYGTNFGPSTIQGGIALLFIFLGITIAMLMILYKQDFMRAFSRTLLTTMVSYLFVLLTTLPTGKVTLSEMLTINIFQSSVLIGILAGIILGARADAKIRDGARP